MIYQFVLRLLDIFNVIVLTYFVVLNIGYFITGLFAFRSLRRYVRRLRTLDIEDLLGSAGMPPITLVAPAFNEEPTCVESTRSLLTLKYGEGKSNQEIGKVLRKSEGAIKSLTSTSPLANS